MFSFEPDEEQALLRATARELAESVFRPHAHDADEAESAPDDVLARAWEQRLAVGALPEAFGGAGMSRSAVTGALMAEELAHGDLSLALGALAPALVAYPVLDFGTDQQKESLLAQYAGAAPPRSSAALVEPSLDFDPTELQTLATRTGDGYRLNGRKCLVPLGSKAEVFLVYASEQPDGLAGVQAFIVPRGTPGLTLGSRERNMGLRALDTIELTLDDVRVSADARLGGERGIDFALVLSQSRVALGALAVGVARAAYEHALDYARQRVAFGEAIAQRQAIAFMLAEMALEIDAARLLVWEAAWTLDQRAGAAREAHLAKTYADQISLKVCDNAVQILGGHGYIRDNPVERWLRNARGFAVCEGLAIV